LTPLEDRTLPATGLSVSLGSDGILRVADWRAGDSVAVHQTVASVVLDATGYEQTFTGVTRVFVDVQSDASVLNDTAGLGGAAARQVYLTRRDPTGTKIASSGNLAPGTAPGTTSGPPTGGTAGTGTGTVPPPPKPDWFDAALNDPTLRAQARSLAADKTLDRIDLLKLFAQAASDGTVSAAEFHDLTALVNPDWSLAGGGSNTPQYAMPDSVRSLASKVVGDDPANASYQGAALGDLHASSAGDQLTKLVNKWFLGLDRPKASSGTTYRPVDGPLFQGGPSAQDVLQGRTDDCYYLAALAEVAQDRPQAITDMFTDNGDGTITVRFFHDGVADYVTVDRFLPTDAAGNRVYAGFGSGATTELWVALAEKAYAQLNASGWIGQDGTNTYAGIAEGYGDAALQHITGQAAGFTRIVATSADQLAAAVTAGLPTILDSRPSPGNGVVPAHAYGVASYNAATQKFTLYNPQGGTIQLNWTQIVQSFSGYWQSAQ
jgi:hypothetical protein